MKYLLLLLIFISCKTNTGTVTQAQVNDTIAKHDPMPVLHAYRKEPVDPKTEEVKSYKRKDGKVVKGYKRSKKAVIKKR